MRLTEPNRSVWLNSNKIIQTEQNRTKHSKTSLKINRTDEKTEPMKKRNLDTQNSANLRILRSEEPS